MDGYLAAKGHGLDWLYDTGSPEETSYDEFYSHMDVTLNGAPGRSRRSEKQGIQPLFIHPQKIMSSPTGALSCPGFTAVNGDPVEFVKDLGQDRNIWVVGGKYHSCPAA